MAREVAKKVKVKGPKGQPGFAILYSDGTIFIEWVRFSHPHIHAPWKKKEDQGPKKYSVTAMLPKKTHAAAIELVEGRIAELLKENKVKKLKPEKIFLRDGDESEAEEYEGYMTISAREERRPPMRHKNGKPIPPGEDEDGINLAEELFVGGHWGAVLIRPWFMNNDYGKRVNAGLSSIQFLMKDETFGSGRLSEEDLDDMHRSHDDDDDDDGSVDDEDEDEDDRPRRKKKPSRRDDDDDDDEDDRPRKKKRRSDYEDDDDDEDERPRKKKRRSRDDDDDI